MKLNKKKFIEWISDKLPNYMWRIISAIIFIKILGHEMTTNAEPTLLGKGLYFQGHHDLFNGLLAPSGLGLLAFISMIVSYFVIILIKWVILNPMIHMLEGSN